MHLHSRLLDVVLHAVEERALVDDEHREVLEQLGEVRDRFGDLRQLVVASPEIWLQHILCLGLGNFVLASRLGAEGLRSDATSEVENVKDGWSGKEGCMGNE